MSNLAFGSLSPWLRFRPPPESLPAFQVRPFAPQSEGVVGFANWRPPATLTAQAALDSAASTPAASPPGWEQSTGPASTSNDGSEPRWPWLRAPIDEVPGFRLNPDGSLRNEAPANKLKLMEGALTPPEPHEQPHDSPASYGATSTNVMPSSPAGMQPLATAATALALPESAGAAIDVAALAARAASALPTAASAGLALPMLFTPTNTGSETIDLGGGFRARVRPGQRTLEVERRVDDGLLGTGLGAKWETVPVEAWQHVGRDGRVNFVFNQEQLNRARGLGNSAELKTGGVSAMARPPKDDDQRPLPPPPPGVGAPANEQSHAPTRIDANALEETTKRDPEEERLLACRAVRAMPGQPAPPGQFDGPGGVDTAVGIRVAPGFPAPKGGYDYAPNYLRHFNGYKGELELKNRIEKAVPYEQIVYYGNPAGVQGPDVISIGPKGLVMEWNSRSAQAPRRITRPGIPSAKYGNAENHIYEAIDSGAVSKDVAMTALQQLSQGNFDVCTVGTGSAYDGYYVAVRNGIPSHPQR